MPENQGHEGTDEKYVDENIVEVSEKPDKGMIRLDGGKFIGAEFEKPFVRLRGGQSSIRGGFQLSQYGRGIPGEPSGVGMNVERFHVGVLSGLVIAVFSGYLFYCQPIFIGYFYWTGKTNILGDKK
jgi:hypothetical protein